MRVASLFALGVTASLTVSAAHARDIARVQAAGPWQAAELTILGDTAERFGGALGVEGRARSLLFSVDADGAVRLIDETAFSADVTVLTRTGGVELEASESASESSGAGQALVITGAAARALYHYLQLGRRLSITIDDNGATIVGENLTCNAVLGRTFTCTLHQ